MSETIIPAVPEKRFLICDYCKREGVKGKSGVFCNGGIHIRKAERWGVMLGGDKGGMTFDRDFCLECWDNVIETIGNGNG